MVKKVLMTASSLGHICNFHLPYIKAFDELGWEVSVVGDGPMRDIPAASRVYCMPFEKKFTSLVNFKTAGKMRKLMQEEQYDLVICHTSLAAFFARLASVRIKGKTKLINVVHGYLFDDKTHFAKAAVLKTAEYLMAGQTDLVITMNQWDYNWASNHKVAKQVGYIPGIGISERTAEAEETPMLPECAEGDFVLVYPAEFSRRKHQEMLVRSMAFLPERVKLVLPGNGELQNECKELAGQLGISDRVLFPGYVNNVFSLLSKADAAVSSSRSEGLPFNIMEAMLCGLPVIASAVKGNEDLIQNDVNGILFDYDDERAFAAAVEKIMSDKKRAAEMGAAGQKMVKNYMLDRVMPQLMELYLKG